MKTGRMATFASWAALGGFLLVWLGIVCRNIFAGGGGEPAYRLVRWLAGLEPE
jgi:hypothetical protein